MSFRDGKLVGIVGLKGQNSRRRRRDEVDGTKDKIFQKKSAAHSIRGRARVKAQTFSPVAEVQLVEPNRVRCLLEVSILLVVDGHAVPRCRCWILVIVEGRSYSVERDRLEQE